MELQYSKRWAAEQVRTNPGTKFVFFWGHRTRPDGALTHSVFSQWYPSPFQDERGHDYPTAEHFMMAEKARLFGDREAEEAIMGAGDPGKAKALGRRVHGFDEQAWRSARVDIVYRGNLLKFGQVQARRAFLLQTGQKILVEASPVDAIWGIGLKRDDAAAPDPDRWRGENLLGFVLMAVRDTLRGEGAAG